MKSYPGQVTFVILFLVFLKLINVDFSSKIVWFTVLLPCAAIIVFGGINQIRKNKNSNTKSPKHKF